MEDGGQNLARSALLMRLATRETAEFAQGVLRADLPHEEQLAIPDLLTADLVKHREERLTFSHDLIGDWSRLRVLVGADPTTSASARERAAHVLWQRAVRLYGQRLLEQGEGGVKRWRQALDRAAAGDGPAGKVVHDLLLEAAFLGTDAAPLLSAAWPLLAADDGQLLSRLLDRFFIVATLPDPRLTTLLGSEAKAASIAHLYRVPLTPLWPAVLTLLHAHRNEVTRLTPSSAARVAGLWLGKSGGQAPLRREAAELALTIARECQALDEEGLGLSAEERREVYESLLASALVLPAEVSQLCLELARRRDLPAEVQARVAAAEQEVEEYQDTSGAGLPHIPPLFWGTSESRALSAPWPDGPRLPVSEEYRSALPGLGPLRVPSAGRPGRRERGSSRRLHR